MRLPCIMQLKCKTWPARDSIANTLFLHPRKHCMIAIGFTSPATLYKLKGSRNAFIVVGLVENQRTTLKENGSIHLGRSHSLEQSAFLERVDRGSRPLACT